MSDEPTPTEATKRWPALARIAALEHSYADLRGRMGVLEVKHEALEKRVTALESRKENKP